MIKQYSKGGELDILLQPLPVCIRNIICCTDGLMRNVNFQKGKCISSNEVAVPTDLIATIVPHGDRPLSFYSFAFKVCPMAFNPVGARYFTTSGRGNKELKSKKMPSNLVSDFVGKV
jgi:hypothetical protein